MKKVFKLISLLLAVSLLLVTVGCSSDSGKKADNQKVKVMKLGSVNAKDRSLNKAMEKFGEIVEKETNGAIKVEVFPDSLLGGDRQILEAVQMGTVQGTTASTGPIAAFAPRMEVFDLPFLFKDKQTAYKVFDGPIGQEVMNDLEQAGMVGLGYWENGFRHLTNSRREVKTIEDIKGLKIRTLESKVHVDTWKMLDANPTPMALPQLYSALEQKVVDGQENPFGVIKTVKFNEVQKYLTKTGHVYNASPFVISKKFWDGLTDKEKDIFKKAAQEAKLYQRQLNEQEDKDCEAYLAANGMQITELNPGEKEKAQQILQPVYKEFSARIGGDLVERVIAATK